MTVRDDFPRAVLEGPIPQKRPSEARVDRVSMCRQQTSWTTWMAGDAWTCVLSQRMGRW
jgi:hypothetical protein